MSVRGRAAQEITQTSAPESTWNKAAVSSIRFTPFSLGSYFRAATVVDGEGLHACRITVSP
jgi:hypothetical protein